MEVYFFFVFYKQQKNKEDQQRDCATKENTDCIGLVVGIYQVLQTHPMRYKAHRRLTAQHIHIQGLLRGLGKQGIGHIRQ